MRRRSKEISIFNISFLDVISGALGAVIILFIAVPKQKANIVIKEKPPAKVSDCSFEYDQIMKCKDEVKSKEQVIAAQKETIEELQNQKSEDAKKTASSTTQIKQESNSVDGKKQVGFNFKGKNIVFLIDISGSMIGDKIGEVKAGLKMLIASMGEDYKIDVVYYPHSRRRTNYPLWGLIQPLRTVDIKNEVYSFIKKLRPRGGTPTKSAMEFVLLNYEEITDIVLLSDGVPSDSGKDEILEMIRRRNVNKVQINTIGVGLKTYGPNSKLFEILEAIAKETKGFNYGF